MYLKNLTILQNIIKIEYPRELLKNNTINDLPVCSKNLLYEDENIRSELNDSKKKL